MDDLIVLLEVEKDGCIKVKVEIEVRKSFNLEMGLLICVYLYKLDDNCYGLVVMMYYIVIDGWFMVIFVWEIVVFYVVQ